MLARLLFVRVCFMTSEISWKATEATRPVHITFGEGAVSDEVGQF